MERYVIEFNKITDVILSDESLCELYKLNEDFWFKVKVQSNDHIFYHTNTKTLLEFLSGKVNITGLFNNSPGDEFFLYVENSGLKIRNKAQFDYKSIHFWNKFYKDFSADELSEFNLFIKECDIKNK